MTRADSLEIAIHDALVSCDYKCEAVLSKDALKGTKKLCPEKHGELAVNYKGKVILQAFFYKKKQIKMFCWKCLQRESSKKVRKKKVKKADPNQINAFGLPDQKKYTGPKTVPPTSIAAHNISKNSSDKMDKRAYNLVSKSPNRTAWELFSMSIDFRDVYDLRRCLSRLKELNKLFNPLERKCRIKDTKMYTWRIV